MGFKKFRQYRSRAEMMQAGYTFDPDPQVSYCRRCNAAVEWCGTPTGKRFPLNWNSCAAHFDSCNGEDPRSQSAASPVANRPAPSSASPPAAATVVRPELVQVLRELALAIDQLRDTLARRAPGASPGGTR